MKAQTIPKDEFRLGITMAGAVSAGCYTGGVMDYLYEILDLWERAKNGEVEAFKSFTSQIPTHKVIIDVMGGASAGAMTTTVAAVYALDGIIKPVSDPKKCESPTGNLLYDSWVFMDDDRQGEKKRLTFEKMWDLDDLKNGKLESFLNSSFIDHIADKVLDCSADKKLQTADFETYISTKIPKFISPDLQVIYSHTLLRGVPLDVNFETPIARTGHKSLIPNHTTFEHYFVSHYHLNQGKPPAKDTYLFFNPYDELYTKNLKLSTISTGAFPVGLKYREFTANNFSTPYIKTIFNRIISGEFGAANQAKDKAIKLNYLPKEFSTFSVDGGAINNEPYREVMSILSNKYGAVKSGDYPAYGVIMIDPFPDRAQSAPEYVKPRDLIDVIPEVLGTLMDQSRIKRREILETDSRNFRSIIFPRKWKKHQDGVKPIKEPIACASVGAFGGFLDKSFRHHDFFLGRDNARNFFRYFFSMPYDQKKGICHPIHEKWTADMVKTFKIEKDGKTYLPIVPDLKLLLLSEQERKDQRYSYAVPKMPKYNSAQLFAMRKAIKNRLLIIIKLLKSRDYSSRQKTQKADETKKLMSRFYRTNLIGRFSGYLSALMVNVAFSLLRSTIASKITKKLIETVLTDLERKDLLKNDLTKKNH